MMSEGEERGRSVGLRLSKLAVGGGLCCCCCVRGEENEQLSERSTSAGCGLSDSRAWRIRNCVALTRREVTEGFNGSGSWSVRRRWVGEVGWVRAVLDDARGSAVLEELPSCSFVRCCGCASDEPSIMAGACVRVCGCVWRGY